MHISNRFVIAWYNIIIIHYAVFNFVIIIVVLIFTNSPFLFILSKVTIPSAYLILPNSPTPSLSGPSVYLGSVSRYQVVLET